MTEPVPEEASTPPRHRGALAWVVVLLCLAYLPLFLGHIIYFRDPALLIHPARWFVRQAVLRGDWPTWNPWQGLGFSVASSPMYGLFYPPNWLYLVVPESLVASMVSWQSFLHVVWGSVGLALVARRLGASPSGMTVAGLAWGLSGFVTAEWTAGVRLPSQSWIPWIALAFLALHARLRERRAWVGAAALAAVPIAMPILAGEPFVALTGIGFGLGTAAVATLGTAGGTAAPRPWRRGLLALSLAVTLGTGAAAVTLLPARAAMPGTERARPIPRDWAEIGSLHPLRLVELVTPGCMGRNPYEEYPARKWVGDRRIDGLPLLYSVYLGAAVVALALVALGRGRRRAGWLAALAGLGVAIALGRHTPVHGLLRTLVPPLAYMRFPEKYLVLTVGWVALLAGLGTTRLLQERGQAWRRTLGLGLLLLGFAGLAPVLLPSPRWAAVARTAGIAGAAAVTAVLAAQYLSLRRTRLAAALVVALVAADLAAAAWPLQGFAPASVATAVPPAAQVILRDHREPLAPPRLFRDEKTEARIRALVPVSSNAGYLQRSARTLIANVANVFGVATVPGYDAALPVSLNELWKLGQDRGQQLLRLLSVSYAMLGVSDPQAPATPIPGLSPLTDPMPGARLYRVDRPLPRVYLAGRTEVVQAVPLSPRLLDEDVVSGETVLLGEEVLPPAPASARPPGTCQLESFGNHEVRARCAATRPAVAVFVEAMAPGWRAAVDGRPARLLLANQLMRGVPLDAGTHEVRLSFSPPGLLAGALVSLLALAALLALALLARRSSPRG